MDRRRLKAVAAAFLLPGVAALTLLGAPRGVEWETVPADAQFSEGRQLADGPSNTSGEVELPQDEVLAAYISAHLAEASFDR